MKKLSNSLILIAAAFFFGWAIVNADGLPIQWKHLWIFAAIVIAAQIVRLRPFRRFEKRR